MRIGIIGFGVVGKGVYELLKDQHEIVKVFARSAKAEGIFCQDIKAVLKAKPEVLIECLPACEEAYHYIKLALNQQINVISSNKAILAKHYHDLLALAKEKGVSLSFEASVGGGIPILHRLQDMKTYDHIHYIQGILNGTTNYILDKIFDEKLAFMSALKMAQALGYAEQDYSSDLTGLDVKYKLALIYNTAYDSDINLADIYCRGIENLDDRAIGYANDNKMVIRLLGYVDRENAFVLPFFITHDAIWAKIHLNNNAINIHSQNMQDVYDIGQGAGRYPTASAICLDVERCMHNQISYQANIKNDKSYRFYIQSNNIEDKYIEKRLQDGCITKQITVKTLKNIIKDLKVFVGGIYDQGS
ncbi:MAG: homoserine dehydrogenase [Erysipelotrichaceae bacterium]|nr:homoserine dehydrogenase [Erysipelotrichaceae bacterium]MDY5251472.1 homoserine dehydrogenase [Erysipelotrichaceae bacterium]